MEVSGQLHAPAALPPGKEPWYPLDRRLGGPQSCSGHGGEEKNSQSPPRIEPQNPDCPARSKKESKLNEEFFISPVFNTASWELKCYVRIHQGSLKIF
jgi:hypothetical protein